MTPEGARVAVDLGAESCRVSLLRWSPDGSPRITLVHRIPNGPVAHGEQLRMGPAGDLGRSRGRPAPLR